MLSETLTHMFMDSYKNSKRSSLDIQLQVWLSLTNSKCKVNFYNDYDNALNTGVIRSNLTEARSFPIIIFYNDPFYP